MKTTKTLLATMLAACAVINANADERRFTYTYEPETLPKGNLEFEQWLTVRSQKTSAGDVGKENFNRFDFREELEYGVTDRYTVSLYLNGKHESYRDVTAATPTDEAELEFEGISIENRYMVLNPADHPIGLTLYLEPTFSGHEAELEQKIIIGQRHGDWKWAVNLVHATEWEDNFHEHEGELEFTAGIARDINANWSVGIEVRDHNELPGYETWENTALFVGPVVSYRQEKWWATLSVMPQVFGRNYEGDPDGYRNLELEGHERYNVRLLLGISL
ncbi:MAG TPA: DUF6662 family protein [Verrucomicrobiae bacterium]|nr:DUF6662 family protein [Verrucomicrobiae bacterium]